MKIVNDTELKLDLQHWLDTVVDDMEEVIIKRKNQKDLVLISLDTYNALNETNYLLAGKKGEILLNSIAESKQKNHSNLMNPPQKPDAQTPSATTYF